MVCLVGLEEDEAHWLPGKRSCRALQPAARARTR
jgi:hypothetical protein